MCYQHYILSAPFIASQTSGADFPTCLNILDMSRRLPYEAPVPETRKFTSRRCVGDIACPRSVFQRGSAVLKKRSQSRDGHPEESYGTFPRSRTCGGNKAASFFALWLQNDTLLRGPFLLLCLSVFWQWWTPGEYSRLLPLMTRYYCYCCSCFQDVLTRRHGARVYCSTLGRSARQHSLSTRQSHGYWIHSTGHMSDVLTLWRKLL